jgi:hypothetical protein
VKKGVEGVIDKTVDVAKRAVEGVIDRTVDGARRLGEGLSETGGRYNPTPPLPPLPPPSQIVN